MQKYLGVNSVQEKHSLKCIQSRQSPRKKLVIKICMTGLQGDPG